MCVSLGCGDNDFTEVVLMFGQLLYEICEVFGWFVWGKLVRYEFQRFGLQSSRVEVLWTVMVFEDLSTHKKLSIFSYLFPLQMLPLFIGQRFVNKG